MAWFSGRVSLGNFPDLAGAVNKISESVKNMEKNFDSALGLEEKAESHGEASGVWPSTDTKALFEPVMAFMGQKGGEDIAESSKEYKSPEHPTKVKDKEVETVGSSAGSIGKALPVEEENEDLKVKMDVYLTEKSMELDANTLDSQEVKSESLLDSVESHVHRVEKAETPEPVSDVPKESFNIKPSDSELAVEEKSKYAEEDQAEAVASVCDESNYLAELVEGSANDTIPAEKTVENVTPALSEIRGGQDGGGIEPSD